MKKAVTFRTNPKLWKRFGDVIEALKKKGLLGPDESRATIINLFMDTYILRKTKELAATR